jgi:hypothetical protein
MYALVTLWQLPDGRVEDTLPEPVIRRARRAPGFLADYWTHEAGNGKSFGFMVLDSAAHARELCAALEHEIDVGSQSAARLEMSRVQRIILHTLAEVERTAAETF